MPTKFDCNRQSLVFNALVDLEDNPPIKTAAWKSLTTKHIDDVVSDEGILIKGAELKLLGGRLREMAERPRDHQSLGAQSRLAYGRLADALL